MGIRLRPRLIAAVTGMMVCTMAYTIAWANPAGVIAYACRDGQGLVLLAYDPAPGRGYGAFGGGQKDNETIPQIAAREFREETRCTFDVPDAHALAEMHMVKSGIFHTYVAEVPYVPPLEFGQHPCDAPAERSGWQWFDLGDLLNALSGESATPELVPVGGESAVTLWDLSATAMRRAVEDGVLHHRLCEQD